jgi:hypothetical protein
MAGSLVWVDVVSLGLTRYEAKVESAHARSRARAPGVAGLPLANHIGFAFTDWSKKSGGFRRKMGLKACIRAEKPHFSLHFQSHDTKMTFLEKPR